MPTFSQVVDKVVQIGLRPGRRLDVQAYTRASIRECQVLAVFARDMIEDAFMTDKTEPFIWKRPAELRILKTLYYKSFNIWPQYLPPGKIQRDEDYYYYGGPDYYALAGVHDKEVEVLVAYYAYAPRFTYYDANSRPAYYLIPPENDPNTEEKWQYLNSQGQYVDNLATPEEEEAARKKVTNWLLFDWTELIEEGALAKLFKVVNDDRATTSFSLYKSYQKDLLKGERTETLMD